MRCIAQTWDAAPIAVGVGIDAILPIVGPSDRAPLRLEPVCNELLCGLCLCVLAEVRHQELLTGVCESAEAPARTAASLVAQPFPEEVRVVQQLGSAVAHLAAVCLRAQTILVELAGARLAHVEKRHAIRSQGRSAAVAVVVEVRAAAVVVRGRGARHAARTCLELMNHPLHMLSGMLEVRRFAGRACGNGSTAKRHFPLLLRPSPRGLVAVVPPAALQSSRVGHTGRGWRDHTHGSHRSKSK
mmetsp:Transcript_87216/g.222197  ORF Transcript_87216/g.222197 Transcript_87216/m.222197 type:complete len:243 (-) Transcript_87216:49-777(-)